MPARDIAVVGAPLDLGAGGRRGVDMGPSAIRYAGLGERLDELGLLCRDRGNVEAPLRETAMPGEPRARYLDAIRETCERVSVSVAGAATAGLTPLVLGGDHSVALERSAAWPRCGARAACCGSTPTVT